MEKFKERAELGTALQGPSWGKGFCANHLGWVGKVSVSPFYK